MQTIKDVIRTWRAGIHLLVIIAIMFIPAALVGALSLYGLFNIGVISEPTNRAYWFAGLLVLPYFLAVASDSIMEAVRDMDLPPSPLKREVDRMAGRSRK